MSPPAAEPIREQIKAAVASALAGITAGSTYWATPVLVTRALLPPTQYKAELETGPVFGVVRSSGSELGFQAQPATYRDLVRFAVECYVRLRDGVMADTWLERSWADHVVCLLADPSLGGLTLDLRPDLTETDDGEWEPLAGFRQHWVAEVSQELA